MSKICLIGNSGSISKSNDGQVTKVNLYKRKIEEKGNTVLFVDLEQFTKKPLKILRKINKFIKECDRIVLLTAERGIKFLLPYIIRKNKRYNKPFILPMIGINILHRYIDKLNEQQHIDFMLNKNYFCKPSKRYVNNLRKITYILAENEIVAKCVTKFFNLNNVRILDNFRDFTINERHYVKSSEQLRLVYLSRVTKGKGVLELMKTVSELQNENKNISLDIYGKQLLTDLDLKSFNSLLSENIAYKGLADFNEVIGILSQYDCFVFPTLFKSEGTPGVIVESLMAGTPIISSNFIQSRCLLENLEDSIVYDSSEVDGLKNAILKIYNNEVDLKKFSENCLKNAKRFTYKYNRNLFCKYVCGSADKK